MTINTNQNQSKCPQVRDDSVNYGIFKYLNPRQLLKYLPGVFNRRVKCLWDNVKEGKNNSVVYVE